MPEDRVTPNSQSQKADTSNKNDPLISVKEVKPDLRKKEQPLVDVKVTNPVRYIKSWWKRIIGNEGFELKIKIKPLTTIAVTIIIVTFTLGIGKFNLPFKIPFFEFTEKELLVATPEPTPTPIAFRETAFVGVLRFDEATNSYYLLTESSEAIKLDVKESVDLEELVDSRIFATGDYFGNIRTLVVVSASDMEVLPDEIEPIPTITPTLTPKSTVPPSPTELQTSCQTDTDCKEYVSHNTCELFCVNSSEVNNNVISGLRATCDSTLWDPPFGRGCSCVNKNCQYID